MTDEKLKQANSIKEQISYWEHVKRCLFIYDNAHIEFSNSVNSGNNCLVTNSVDSNYDLQKVFREACNKKIKELHEEFEKL